ncbi:FAR1-related sequence 5-like protein, partial [Tanacetum coccineum]
YKMVFVLFTAIDHHRRSVTVGSGLLKKETTEAYGWLLRAFRKAFVRAPNIVVTDQDGAMRLAVAAEFPESKHRLFMWHIILCPEFMMKLISKLNLVRSFGIWNKLVIVFRIYDETDFKAKFGLLLGQRAMRTTSRSESENSFFTYFTSSSSTLVKFMLCYESAMERQRHMQEKLDHQSFDSFLSLLTPLPIELHAAKVYTHRLFTRVQTEIVVGSWLCLIKAISSDEGCDVYVIDEEKPKPKPVAAPEVIDKESTSENVEEEEINLHQKVTGQYKVIMICFDYLYEGVVSGGCDHGDGGSRDGGLGSVLV